MIIQNPIIPGFHPDPSICRAGKYYYLAVSTFEWYPGVQILKSEDLVNWQIHSYALTRISQLNMQGNPDSGGIHAPCLTYNNGKFFLAFTNVRSVELGFRDHQNYLVTTDNIDGSWSDPVFLNCTGFDPSLFHDDDGKIYLAVMVWDHTSDPSPFAGIAVQELDPDTFKPLSEMKIVFDGTELDCTEGPHIYKRKGYYYLMTAEGGTDLKHAVTMARSKDIYGPYEVDPEGPVITAWSEPEHPLQKTGHGDWIVGPDGKDYMVYLCSRKKQAHGSSILGRETSLERMIWTEDAWLRTESGSKLARAELEMSVSKQEKFGKRQFEYDFAELQSIPAEFQTLRIPASEEDYSFKENNSALRLTGRESMVSRHRQTLLARRQQAFSYDAVTEMDFNPKNFQQLAGITAFYNTRKFYYLAVSRDKKGKKCIFPVVNRDGVQQYPEGNGIEIPENTTIHLKISFRKHVLSFFYSLNGESWVPVSDEMESNILSDEFGQGWSFTGSFVGLACQDLEGSGVFADFTKFSYCELDNE